MPDYDKLVDQISADDAQALIDQNGMSDHPGMQKIVRKLKGAETRKRIAAATADGKPLFDGLAPVTKNPPLPGVVDEYLRNSDEAMDVAGNQIALGAKSAWHAARNVVGAYDDADRAAAADDLQDQSHALSAAQERAGGLNAAAGAMIAGPSLPVGIIGNTTQRAVDMQDAGKNPTDLRNRVDLGGTAAIQAGLMAAGGATGAGAAKAAGLINGTRMGLTGVRGALVEAGTGAAAGAGATGAQHGLDVATGNPEFAPGVEDYAINTLANAVVPLGAAAHGVARGVGDHLTAVKTRAEAQRSADAAAHEANIQAQTQAAEAQQGIQNAQLVTPQMRSGPDGGLVPAKAIAPRNPQPVDVSVKPHAMPPISDINAIYGDFSGKSKPPRSSEHEPLDMLGTAKEPARQQEHLDDELAAHEQRALDEFNSTKENTNELHGQIREEPQQGTERASLETRGDQANVRPNEGRSAGVEEAQGARGHEIQQERRLGPVREGQPQEGLNTWQQLREDERVTAHEILGPEQGERWLKAKDPDAITDAAGITDVSDTRWQRLYQGPDWRTARRDASDIESIRSAKTADELANSAIKHTIGGLERPATMSDETKNAFRQTMQENGITPADLEKAMIKQHVEGGAHPIDAMQSVLGPDRYAAAEKNTSLSSAAREYVAKQPPEMRAALQESLDHLQQHPDPQGDLGNLQMVVQGLEHRAAKRAMRGIDPTRGGAVNIGAIADGIHGVIKGIATHVVNALKHIGSWIANDSVLVNITRRAGGAVRQKEYQAEKILHGLKKLSKPLQDAFNRYVDGDKTVVLPPKWKAQADHFRRLQDETSALAATHLNKAADHLDKRAASTLLGDDHARIKAMAQELRHHAATFMSNIGNYVNRQYAIHTEGAKWINKVRDTPAYHDAIADAQARNPNLSPDQARASIERLMQDQLPDALAPIKGSGSVTGAMNERSDVPPAIRKLFGEVTDPGKRAAISLMKTGQLLENLKVQNSIADSAAHFGLLNDMPKVGADKYVQLGSIGSLKNSPIGGMYAPRAIARQLVGINAQNGIAMRIMAGLTAATNASATVGNLAASLPRQFMANPILAFSSGYMTPHNLAAGGKMYARALADEAYRGHLMSLNVIDQGMTASQLGASLSKMKKLESSFNAADNALTTGKKYAFAAFSLADDMHRVLSFASELKRAENRGMRGPEAERWASERMGDSTPDWAKAWKLSKAVSTHVPLLGQFAAMNAEMMRIQIKSIQHTAEAWKSGQHGEAVMRTVGLSATMAASYGLAQYFLNKYAGVSPEEDTAMRTSAATPNYTESHIQAYGDKGENGKRSIRDLSGLDPWYPTSEPIRQMAAGKPLAALGSAISPYIGLSMFGQRAAEAASGAKVNDQGVAQPLSKPDASGLRQWGDRVGHVAGGLVPATIRKAVAGQPYAVFPTRDFVPQQAAKLDVKNATNTYDAYVKDVYAEAAKRGDGTLTDVEAKQIATLQNKRDADLAAVRAQAGAYGASANDLIGAERSNKIRAVDIAHPGDANPDLIKARYRLATVEKALATFEEFKQLSNNDPAKVQFFQENADLIRASAKAYGRYQEAKKILNIVEVHPERADLIQRAMDVLK